MNFCYKVKRIISKWIWLFALVLSVLNIIVVCRCNPSSEITFDYNGIIIGALSILVTVLIGWNIYSVVDFKKITESIKSEMDVLKNDTSNNIAQNSKRINEVSKEVSNINENNATLEQEYYERIKNVESFFIETSFNLVQAKQDETIIVVVVRGFEFVLWLAQKKDFDKACKELKIVHNGIKKREQFIIPGAYIKKIIGLIFDLGKYEKIKEMPEYDDLRDMFGLPTNHKNNNIDK